MTRRAYKNRNCGGVEMVDFNAEKHDDVVEENKQTLEKVKT